MRRGCGCRDCAPCSAYLRVRDLTATALNIRLAEQRGEKLYVQLAYEHQWRPLYYKLWRAGMTGHAAYEDTDDDGNPCLIVVASGPPGGKALGGVGDSAENIIAAMNDAARKLGDTGRSFIVHHSDSWPLSSLESTGEFERVGIGAPESATPERLKEIAAAVKGVCRIDESENSPYVGTISLPSGATEDDENYLDHLLLTGDMVPRSVWDAMRRCRAAPLTAEGTSLLPSAVSGAADCSVPFSDDLGDRYGTLDGL
jgi:hypothetical protein